MPQVVGDVRRSGLDAREAARRLAEVGPNELPAAAARGLLRQTVDRITQPMLLLLLLAGLVNLLIADLLDGLALLATVVVVIVISVVQEHKTENALTALRELSSPQALVLRDGRRQRIPGRELVPGDVLLLSEGDRVPADADLVEAGHLSVDESAMTGESVPVRKRVSPPGVQEPAGDHPDDERAAVVLSGSLVVKGHGVGIVRATGAATELGRIGTALRDIRQEPTPLQREVDRLVRVVAVVAVSAAGAVVVLHGLTRGDWAEGLLAGIATAMAMLPEEFPVVLTVFLALGAWRMAQHDVLARRPAVIETLGSATVVCTDKTGTLTANRMTVVEFLVDGEAHRLTDGPLPERFHAIADTGGLASPVRPVDPMDRAFREAAVGAGPTHDGWELVREYPLSDDLLVVCNVWRPPGPGGLVVAAKGAPEAVAELCRLDPRQRHVMTSQVEAATASGERVLAVARARVDGPGPALPDDPRGFAFDHLGLVGLHDPVRAGVPAAVAECGRAGIRVVMVTGDYPGTAMAIAREVGIDTDGGYLAGAELDVLDDVALAARVREVSVFARVAPEQKLRLVRAFRDDGEVVGMTGDGVNDAPALRAADIGIAMGGRGTDVAREAASLAIVDDDFASIVRGIRLGRGIYDNLRKATAYILAVHVPLVGMALVPVLVADWPLVLLPIQVAFLEFIIDPACSVVFESEELDPRIMEVPPRPPGTPMLGRRELLLAVLQGVSALLATVAVYLWAVRSGRPDEVVRSLTFATLVVGNLSLILVNRSWRLTAWRTLRQRRNRTVPWILAAAAGVLVALLSVPPVRRAFDLGPLRPADWAVVVAAGVTGVVWFELRKVLLARRRDGSTDPRREVEVTP